MSIMDQPVKDSIGNGGIADLFMSVLHGELAGDDGGGMAVSFLDDLASSPTQPGYLEFTVQKAGVVTSALHEMEVGAVMGIRGPLGNSWPIDYLAGKNIVIVGDLLIKERQKRKYFFGRVDHRKTSCANATKLSYVFPVI